MRTGKRQGWLRSFGPSGGEQGVRVTETGKIRGGGRPQVTDPAFWVKVPGEYEHSEVSSDRGHPILEIVPAGLRLNGLPFLTFLHSRWLNPMCRAGKAMRQLEEQECVT